jgi:hypothetical protein
VKPSTVPIAHCPALRSGARLRVGAPATEPTPVASQRSDRPRHRRAQPDTQQRCREGQREGQREAQSKGGGHSGGRLAPVAARP